ncbi:MAG: UDP-N-acetylmuramoyl-tripeptide--D-alanyl-D-alanine ligase [Bacilli bacterium]|nr:UDP-N-acetylmuramoyl-tripeptide--D-alanyl-D-alanine ligase [Bacilli bacterium]MDD4406568.1 UDP-N-acetylmuramoyl-tripeptide--D-alanyl-D-alanine ligase [Bacilli bacterium]
MKVKDIIKTCDGILFSGNLDLSCNNFSKDTRTINKGDVYIGIKGDNFDGNIFYQDAFNNGACACILEESFILKIKKTDKTIIIVKNSIEALKKLAIKKLKEKKIPVIAVTGSLGKTSTRNMIYSVVSKKYKTLVTEKNYNNNIGVPLTILKLKDEELILLEMGMNHIGEIEYLTSIAKPDIAIITNVLPIHIENLGSMENILKAKLEILSGLKENGALIINNDNKYLNNIMLKNVNVITCGIENNSDYMAYNIKKYKYKVNIKDKIFCFNNHIGTKPYILNGLLAIATGLQLNIDILDIQNGINEYLLTEGRLEKTTSKKGVIIINDSYNASAESMINAIDFLLNQKELKKIAILGDINETGTYAQEIHEKVGKYLAKNNIDYLITIGNNSEYINIEAQKGMDLNNIIHFETKSDAKDYIKNLLNKGDIVLVKASNGNKFIEIVEYIKEFC